MVQVFGPCSSGFPLLRRHGIATMSAVGRYLGEVYIAEHNRALRSPRTRRGAFVLFLTGLHDILCIRHERVVGNYNRVRYDGWVLQIPEQRHRQHARALLQPSTAGGLPSGRHPDRERRRLAISGLIGSAAAQWICGQSCGVAHNPRLSATAADI